VPRVNFETGESVETEPRNPAVESSFVLFSWVLFDCKRTCIVPSTDTFALIPMTDEERSAGRHSRVLAGKLAPGTWAFKVSLIAAAVVIAALSVVPFFLHIPSTPSGRVVTLRLLLTHDLNEHLVVMEQFDKSLRSGVLYPRWLPDVNGEYGNAWTNFYPPLCYYLASAIHAVVGDWAATVAVLCVVAMAASGIAFYILSRVFYGRAASAIGASLYILLPYHVLDLYWRGALPELLGFVYLPLLIYFAFRLGNGGKLVDYTGLGLTYGLYVMTHLPIGYLMSYVLAGYAIVWSLREKRSVIFLRIAGGMGLGLLVCAIYLLPAALEAKYAHEATSAIFPYDNSYLPALPPRDNFGDTLNHSFMLQALALAISLIALRAMRHAKGESKLVSRSPAGLWAVLGVSATLMVTSLSFYVSKLIPRTDLVAFPWRWLAIAGLFTSLLVAAAIDSLSVSAVGRTRRMAYLAAILFVACVNVWFTAQRVIGATLVNTSTRNASKLVEASYTPKGATLPQNLADTPRVVIDPEGGGAEILRWDPQHREVHLKVSEPSRVRLKTYNFPGWVARVDGQPALMLSDKDGVQLIEVPPGVHRIEVSLVNTPTRTLGALLSALGLLVAIGLAALHRIREAKGVAAGPTSQRALPVRLLRLLAAVVGILLIVAVTLLWLSGRGRSGRPPASSGGASAQEGGSASSGSEASLHIDGIPSILVALDERALDELMNALPARDNSKVDALIQSGQVISVTNDTRVRVLSFGTGKTRVRILEGEHSMVEGWVPERWVR